MRVAAESRRQRGARRSLPPDGATCRVCRGSGGADPAEYPQRAVGAPRPGRRAEHRRDPSEEHPRAAFTKHFNAAS